MGHSSIQVTVDIYGHLVVAEEVYSVLDLAEMLFVPAGQPPHKPNRIVTGVQHRLAMLELAVVGNPHFSISRVDLDRPGPSYTVETLRLLREQWGELTALYFVIGWDSLEDLLTWYDPAGILQQLSYLVAVRRPGYNEHEGYRDSLEARLPGISTFAQNQVVDVNFAIGIRTDARLDRSAAE